MQVFLFHLMPYADLDFAERAKHKAAWVVLPNALFDPEKGHLLYNRFLDELEYAEQVGFDGVCVNEHHQNAYGLMPSPVVMASALSRRTSRAKIAILGNAFCLREHPLTLAEEHAMIDCITEGRLISGFVRGIGAEYYSMGGNPTTSLARHQEAHDLVIRAWTEEGPFAFEGKHYHFEYVNLWPRPYQQPHPPIWCCPSQGSTETIQWASHSDRRYVYLQTYSPLTSVSRYLNLYREMARDIHGYDAASTQIGWAAPTYVAETDEQAIEQARPHIEAFFSKFLTMPLEMHFPPGYLSPSSLKGVLKHKRQLRGGAGPTIEQLIEVGTFVCGSPQTVLEHLRRSHNLSGFQNYVAMMQFATLPSELTRKSIDLFAEKVMPELRSFDDDNSYPRRAGPWEAAAVAAAVMKRRPAQPRRAGPRDRNALPDLARGLERLATRPCSQYHSGGAAVGAEDVDCVGAGMEFYSRNRRPGRRSPRADDNLGGRHHGHIYQRGLEEMAQAQADAARR